MTGTEDLQAKTHIRLISYGASNHGSNGNLIPSSNEVMAISVITQISLELTVKNFGVSTSHRLANPP